LATFFDKVARLSRIVNINNITINRGKDSKDLSTSCTAVTYKFVEPPPAAAPRPAAANPAPKPNAEQEDVQSKSKANKKNL